MKAYLRFREVNEMVSFERKAHNWGIIKASIEEWEAIKSLIEHVTQPDIFYDSDLEIMSAMDHENWELWVKKFSNYDKPPFLIARSELTVIFATALNASDAQVKGLSDDHKAIIEELLCHCISDAVECG